MTNQKVIPRDPAIPNPTQSQTAAKSNNQPDSSATRERKYNVSSNSNSSLPSDPKGVDTPMSAVAVPQKTLLQLTKEGKPSKLSHFSNTSLHPYSSKSTHEYHHLSHGSLPPSHLPTSWLEINLENQAVVLRIQME